MIVVADFVVKQMLAPPFIVAKNSPMKHEPMNKVFAEHNVKKGG
jgi:hypothetical protein